TVAFLATVLVEAMARCAVATFVERIACAGRCFAKTKRALAPYFLRSHRGAFAAAHSRVAASINSFISWRGWAGCHGQAGLSTSHTRCVWRGRARACAFGIVASRGNQTWLRRK